MEFINYLKKLHLYWYAKKLNRIMDIGLPNIDKCDFNSSNDRDLEWQGYDDIGNHEVFWRFYFNASAKVGSIEKSVEYSQGFRTIIFDIHFGYKKGKLYSPHW